MKFNFRVLTNNPERLNVISTKLGASKDEVYKDADVGKPMVMGKKGNMVIAAADQEIEGFLDNVDAGPTEDGHVFGGVARCGQGTRYEVELVGTADVLDLVVAAANEAVGVKADSGLGKVQKGVPTTHIWRIIAFTTDAESGTAGDIAIIERV